MKKVFLSLLLLAGCESDQQIYERMHKRKLAFDSLIESKPVVVSILEGYRHTTIGLSDGRKIIILSGKHNHETIIEDAKCEMN
jgi:uncharacterized protein YcfL